MLYSCTHMATVSIKGLSWSVYCTLAVSQACLVYDGRLVIDSNFETNDPLIRAAGPLTKYQRRFYTELTHADFNSKEIGVQVSRGSCSREIVWICLHVVVVALGVQWCRCHRLKYNLCSIFYRRTTNVRYDMRIYDEWMITGWISTHHVLLTVWLVMYSPGATFSKLLRKILGRFLILRKS